MTDIDDQAVTLYQQQIGPLADAYQRTSDLLGEIEQPLGQLYTQAEQSGNQDMLTSITAVWQKSQEIAAQLPPFVAALQAGAAAIDEVRDQRNQFARELSNLAESLESFNTNDPRLARFAEVLESEVYEYMYDEAMEAAEMYFYDTQGEEIFEYLMTNFTTSHLAVDDLIEYLRGNGPDYRDEQRNQLIQDLLDTFKIEVKS